MVRLVRLGTSKVGDNMIPAELPLSSEMSVVFVQHSFSDVPLGLPQHVGQETMSNSAGRNTGQSFIAPVAEPDVLREGLASRPLSGAESRDSVQHATDCRPTGVAEGFGTLQNPTRQVEPVEHNAAWSVPE